jgi:hypothetical protein
VELKREERRRRIEEVGGEYIFLPRFTSPPWRSVSFSLRIHLHFSPNLKHCIDSASLAAWDFITSLVLSSQWRI